MLQLRDRDRLALRAALARFPEVRHAWVFGSRAQGRARRASDIDLAIDAPGLPNTRWQALLDALEQAPVIYHLDIVRFDPCTTPSSRRPLNSNVHRSELG